MEAFVKNRFQFIFFLTILLLFLILIKTFWLQIIKHKKFHSIFINQSHRTQTLKPLRGSILDRNGQLFSVSHYQYTVKIAPHLIVDKDREAVRLSQILDMDLALVKKKMALSKKAIYLKRKINNKIYQKLSKENISGVFFDLEQKREYPQKQMACHVLGFIGDDGYGLEGIEGKYNEILEGKEGKRDILQDARFHHILISQSKIDFPREGCDIILTIDQRIQYLVEREMSIFFSKHSPLSISIIVMNPENGEILALANRPCFDPNHLSRGKYSQKRKQCPKKLI